MGLCILLRCLPRMSERIRHSQGTTGLSPAKRMVGSQQYAEFLEPRVMLILSMILDPFDRLIRIYPLYPVFT